MTVKVLCPFFCCLLLLPFALSAQNSDDIIFSSKTGKIQQVDALIKKGADLNVRDETGASALMWASLRGNREIVQLLVAAKAELNLQDSRGSTALFWAAMRGKKDVVSILLGAGADLSRKDLQGKTASMIAEENGYHDLSVLISGFSAKGAKPAAALTMPVSAAASVKDSAVISGSSALEAPQPISSSARDYYPAKAGDSWSMVNAVSGTATAYYVLDSDAGKASIQCESKKAGKRQNYYRQVMSYGDDAVRVSVFNRDEIILKSPLVKGTKWFVEKNNAVIEREIVLVGETVSFSGKDYSCIVTRDIMAIGQTGRKGSPRRIQKEVHYHCYAKGAGYLGTKTAAFEKSGAVEHIPSFPEIAGWFLVRQRSEN